MFLHCNNDEFLLPKAFYKLIEPTLDYHRKQRLALAHRSRQNRMLDSFQRRVFSFDL
mgnify:CR=1 FL=1